ncbi:MAG: heavy-metal-associated domain-containing protein [Dehalococcoidia bacterium]
MLKVTGALKALPGVTGARMNLATNLVAVSYDPNAVSEEAFATAVASTGFKLCL